MDQVVLLDTHTLLWLAMRVSKLSRKARTAIERAATRVLADISLREVAALQAAGRIDLGMPAHRWLEEALTNYSIEVAATTPRIADRSTRIAQNFHGDPADQLIAATAIELGVPLVTIDEKLRASPALRTIW